jgi:hypothetical protein
MSPRPNSGNADGSVYIQISRRGFSLIPPRKVL